MFSIIKDDSYQVYIVNYITTVRSHRTSSFYVNQMLLDNLMSN